VNGFHVLFMTVKSIFNIKTMKKNYWYLLGLLLLLVSAQTYGQGIFLGKSSDLLRSIKERSETSTARSTMRLPLTIPSSILQGKINYRTGGTDREYVIGEIENVSNASFYLRIEGTLLEGHIILRDSKKAYKYYSDSNGNAYVSEVSIHEVLCINFDQPPAQPGANLRAQAAAVSQAALSLESYPGGNGCVLLDVDGQYVSGTLWNNGNPINAAPANLTDAQVQETWEIVSEDFRPFHLNVTTSEAVFNAYPKNRRMRCIITPTNTAAPGAGGVAYIGSFNWNDDTPCWVFNGGVKGAAEAASHEVGHTFGLGHDGRTSPSEGYYAGHGNWAPIMGVGYYESVTQWSKGEYTNANNKEDDLAKMSSATYGVGYRADDRGNTIATATALQYSAAGTVAASQNFGVIERTGDVDVFSFTTSGGTVTLNANPAARHADLDILLTLYNSSGGVVTTANPTTLAAGISASLNQGTYYLAVDGTGSGNPATDGYSDYASLGSYSISGTIPPPVTTTAAATFYHDCNFSTNGYVVGLDQGNYTTAQLVAKGILNNDISSLKVQSGYEVVLYKGDNFQGTFSGFTADVGCLVSFGINDSTSSLRVRSVSNQLPVVSITSPAAGAVLATPANITINANASDADGGIAKVEFFNGTTKLGEDTSSPYSFSWSGVAAGSYTIIAKATDDRGGQSSTQVTVTVGTPVAATIYQHCEYNTAGYIIDLPVGNYTLAQLNARGIADNDISSLKVKSGYEVILYQNDSYQGSAYLFRSDFSCLVSLTVNGAPINLNDWASSVVVRASTATAAATIASASVYQEETPSLSISPNPAANEVTVRLGNKADASFPVKIFTLHGVEVVSEQVQNGQPINVADLEPGIYLLKVYTGKDVQVSRIIKK
jgi:hypothetical protein